MEGREQVAVCNGEWPQQESTAAARVEAAAARQRSVIVAAAAGTHERQQAGAVTRTRGRQRGTTRVGCGAELPVTAVVRRRTHAQAAAAAGSPEAWCSQEWHEALEFHAEVLGRHLADGLLGPSSCAVCLGGAQQALALRELGVAGAVAVARRRSPPLAVAFGWRERERERGKT